jgi:hypothetical protein
VRPKFLRRRRRTVLVDEHAWLALCGRVAVAEAERIVRAASERWHALETTEHRGE